MLFADLHGTDQHGLAVGGEQQDVAFAIGDLHVDHGIVLVHVDDNLSFLQRQQIDDRLATRVRTGIRHLTDLDPVDAAGAGVIVPLLCKVLSWRSGEGIEVVRRAGGDAKSSRLKALLQKQIARFRASTSARFSSAMKFACACGWCGWRSSTPQNLHIPELAYQHCQVSRRQHGSGGTTALDKSSRRITAFDWVIPGSIPSLNRR
ncbi:MAG TPA: hypothetical protein PL007_08735 [Thermomonas sp.]|nr:hypothetical protein [Thermomonas sp.]